MLSHYAEERARLLGCESGWSRNHVIVLCRNQDNQVSESRTGACTSCPWGM